MTDHKATQLLRVVANTSTYYRPVPLCDCCLNLPLGALALISGAEMEINSSRTSVIVALARSGDSVLERPSEALLAVLSLTAQGDLAGVLVFMHSPYDL